MPLRVTVGMFVALTALLLLFVLYGAPLPEGDDGLIEAERRIRALSSERDKLSTEYRDNHHHGDRGRNPRVAVDATQTRLIDYVEETMPRTIAGVAVKLRMLDDENWGVAAALARGIPLLSRTFSNESNGRPGSGAVRR